MFALDLARFGVSLACDLDKGIEDLLTLIPVYLCVCFISLRGRSSSFQRTRAVEGTNDRIYLFEEENLFDFLLPPNFLTD